MPKVHSAIKEHELGFFGSDTCGNPSVDWVILSYLMIGHKGNEQ